MRPLWERMGGPQKSKFPGNPWGKCHTPSSHLLSLQHPSTQSAFTRDETPHPYPLGCLRAKALPHFTHFHTHFGNSTLPIQNQACHPSLQSIVSPSKYKGEGDNSVWHLHFLKHPIGQKSKKAMSQKWIYSAGRRTPLRIPSEMKRKLPSRGLCKKGRRHVEGCVRKAIYVHVEARRD